MAEIKKINTDLQIEAGLLDGDGNSGTANQILISTGTGVDWVDGSGSSIIGGPYLPLAGGTMTGTAGVLMPDNFKLKFGDATTPDLQIYHEGTDSIIQNYTGSIYIDNNADDQDIVFRADDGSGGLATYFRVDGSEVETRFHKSTRHFDNVKALFGDSGDLTIEHTGTFSRIQDNGTGDLVIQGQNIRFTDSTGTDIYATLTHNAGVELRYDNSKKFETTSTGVSVTGGVTAGNATFAGDVLVEDNLYLTDAGTVRGKIQLNASDRDDLDIKAVSLGSNMKFFTVNTERMRIDSDGNVGIGTTSPQSKLQINDGSVNITKAMQSGGVDHDFLQLSYAGSWGNNVGGLASINFTDNLSSSNTVGRIGVTYTGSQGKFVVTDLYSGGYGASGDVFTIQANGQTYIKGNVGIGETNPSAKLDVNGGSDNLLATFKSTDDLAYISFQDNNTTSNTSVALGANDNNLVFFTGTAFGSERMRITNAGNVGIGTTIPTRPLSVYRSTAGSVANFLHYTDSTAFTGLYIDVDNANNIVALNASGDTAATMAFQTGNNERMRIDSSGNVGIGTTSPQAALHVAGSFNATSPTGNGVLMGFYNGTHGYMQLNGPSGGYIDFSTSGTDHKGRILYDNISNYLRLDTNGSEKLRINSAGNVGIGTTSPQSGGGSAKWLSLNGTAAYSGGVVYTIGSTTKAYSYFESDYLKQQAQTGFGQKFIVNGTNTAMTILSGGNVGIGTTSPGRPLTINSDTSHRAIRILENDSGNESWDIGVDVDGDLNFFNSADTSPSVTFLDNGNVGIGTANPLNKLFVSANTAGDYAAFIENTNSTNGYGLVARTANTGTSSYAFAARAASSDIFVVRADGNVGIGTTSPSSRLTVQAAGSQTTQRAITIFHNNTLAGGYASIGAQYTATNGYIDSEIRFGSETLNGACSFMSFATGCNNTITQGSNSERMRIDSSGNVGIGTTSPSQKLHINNSTASSASYAKFSNAQTGTTTADGFDVGVNTGTEAIIWQRENSNLLFATNNTERIRITSGGNVGIGTTNPTFLLQVQGTPPVNNGALINARNSAATATNTTFGGIYFNSSPGNDFSIGKSNVNTVTTLSFRNGNNGVSLMDITPSGNVGIGTTSPAVQLELGDNTADEKLRLTGAASGKPLMTFYNTTTKIGQIASSSVGITVTSLGSGNMSFENGGNTRLVIDNSGNVGIGATSPSSKLHVKDTSLSGTLAYFEASASAQGTTNIRVDCLQYGTGIAFFRDGSLGGGACSFRNDSGTQVGSINIGTSSTLYSTSSDYRLKENLTLITDGIDRLKQLKPKRFNFIGETQIVDGFVAHEAKEVVPESVTGEKDEVLPNGDPVYQGIDQAKIVPLLTAALQEAVAKIEDLENRIQTLENK
jgi:hypothetical protein